MVAKRLCIRRILPFGIVLLLIIFACSWFRIYRLDRNNVKVRSWEDDEVEEVIDYNGGAVDIDFKDPDYKENIDKLRYWEKHYHNKGRDGEKQNFVFIKCMKCATETVASILRRFAFTRDLDVVLPRDDNIYLGWPYLMETGDFRTTGSKFNCLIEHSIYNRTIMKRLFHADVKFITIIREPWSHFLSTFKYFNVEKILNMNYTNPISEYLSNIAKYEKMYKSHEYSKLRFCIPDGFSVTKNLLSHCLGMPLGFPEGRDDIFHHEDKVLNFIKTLDAEMDLVMIMEYFHESLILLKRMMNWSFWDILYRKVNVGHYQYTTSLSDREIHRKWSSIDYQLYQYFNQTFWLKVKSQGESFPREVQLFKTVINDIDGFCKSVNELKSKTSARTLAVEASEFHDGFTVSRTDCRFLNEPLLPLLQERFAFQHGKDVKYKRTC